LICGGSRWLGISGKCALCNATVTPPEEIRVEEIREEKKRATGVATPSGVSDSVFQDFKKLRAAKKSPLTQTALEGITREAAKAGLSLSTVLEMCCERGWAGFKAEWVAEKPKGYTTPSQTLTVPSKTGIDPALAKAIKDASSGTKPPSGYFEKLRATA